MFERLSGLDSYSYAVDITPDSQTHPRPVTRGSSKKSRVSFLQPTVGP